jgi:xylulokinase
LTDASSASATDRHERFVLAIDLGTGGPKIGLVSITGRVAWNDHCPVTTRFLPGGGAVQDAAEWWRLIVDATQRAMASGVVAPHQIEAVSCTGQWSSTVPVDERGEPVGDCVLWMDSRGGPYAHKVIAGPLSGFAPVPLAIWVRRTAGAPSTTGADPIGHMLYILNDEPEVARAARWFLEPVDYLAMRFTGIAAASHASMTGAWLTDNRNLDVLEYDADLVRRSGVSLRRLPPLRATGSTVGTVLPEVAKQLGLPDGVQVVAGTPDLHSGAVGAGTVLPYETNLAISTSSWISCSAPFKKTDIFRQIATVPGLTPDQYLVANNHETGGACLQWLRDQVIAPDDGLTDAAPPSYAQLTDAAATAPTGAGGVIFTPWLAGERSPVDDRFARGGFHNLSLGTTRAHLVRAVLEGVAYNSRWLHDAVEKFVKRRLDHIRFIGGGAQSDLWCQIHADVLDRTVERVADPVDANLRGAALLAGLALGAVNQREVRDLVRVDATFRPDHGRRQIYDRLYAEFPKLYKAQKPMFQRLNAPN